MGRRLKFDSSILCNLHFDSLPRKKGSNFINLLSHQKVMVMTLSQAIVRNNITENFFFVDHVSD